MGYTDIVTKEFMQNPEVFADVLNYFIFQGSPVIQPEDLSRADPVLLSRFQSSVLKEKERDRLMYWTGMEWAHNTFMLFGIENQTLVDYTMPARTMIYDSMQIDEQLQEKRAALQKPYTNAEFICGFHKNDKLKPLVTIVIFFSPNPWDGPLRLHDMYEAMPEATARMVPDYPLHLISPYSLTDEDISLFRSDFHQVMLYIKYSLNKEKLKELAEKNPRMQYFGRDVVKIINAVVNSHLPLPEEGGKLDMCKAHEDMIQEGIEIGIEKGIEKNLLANIRSLMKKNKLSALQAMDLLDTPEDQREHYLALLSSVSQ